MNDHKDAVRISKQPEGTYDHRAVLNLKACYLEVVAQLAAQEWPPITPEETARGIAAAQEVRK